jgi:N-methylhydantoinase B
VTAPFHSSAAPTADASLDLITTEIIRNAILACAHDMSATLIRSAYTPIIYEGKDCSVAILDEHAEVLGQSTGLPVFLGNLETCVKATGERLGWDAFRPGDVFYMNDAYEAGTHLNDATIFSPIFWREQLVGFSTTCAHWLDVGAQDPGGSMNAREVYQEGMRWGPTRIVAEGEPCTEIIETLRLNGRFGTSLVGDMNAQIAACRTGEARFQRILDRFGYDAYLAAREEIYRQSEALEREAVTAIPDGTYHAEGVLDDDGRGSAPLPIRVAIVVEGDRLTIDLEGTAPQVEGPSNVSFTGTRSACRVAFKLLVHPERAVDGGTFKCLEVKVPPASICSAEEPAPTQFYFTPLGLLIDLIVRALAPSMPSAVAAAHYGDSSVVRIAGRRPDDGSRFLMNGPHPGGWGAWDGGDGADGLINVVNGAFKDYPIEVVEQKYPLVVRGYGFRADSGGAGRFRGGCGIYRAIEVQSDVRLYSWFERSVTTAWGLFGGEAAIGPDVRVNPGRDDARGGLLKVNGEQLSAGDVLELRTGGGGGYGVAWERDVARVLDDVRDGFVSPKAAAERYGVVLDAAGDVDEQKTAAARAGLAAA